MPTQKEFNDLHIFNGHQVAQLAGDKVFISYAGPDYRRGGRGGAEVRVYGMGFNTDPEAPHYHHGTKTFYVHNFGGKAEAILAAQTWASVQGFVPAYTEWEKGLRDYWHPKGSVKKAVDAAKKRAETQKWENGRWVPKE